jgi:hypothetical protein
VLAEYIGERSGRPPSAVSHQSGTKTR